MKDPNRDVLRVGVKRLHMELKRSLNAPVRYRQAKPVTPTTTVKAGRRRHRRDSEFCGGISPFQCFPNGDRRLISVRFQSVDIQLAGHRR